MAAFQYQAPRPRPRPRPRQGNQTIFQFNSQTRCSTTVNPVFIAGFYFITSLVMIAFGSLVFRSNQLIKDKYINLLSLKQQDLVKSYSIFTIILLVGFSFLAVLAPFYKIVPPHVQYWMNCYSILLAIGTTIGVLIFLARGSTRIFQDILDQLFSKNIPRQQYIQIQWLLFSNVMLLTMSITLSSLLALYVFCCMNYSHNSNFEINL